MKPRTHVNRMRFLITLLVFTSLILSIPLLPGCNQAVSYPGPVSQPGPGTAPAPVYMGPEILPEETVSQENTDSDCGCGGGMPAASGSAPFGLYAALEFDRAPKTNEATNLSWCIKAAETFKEIHAWVQFEYDSGKPRDSRKLPIAEVEETILLDGQLSFDGSLKEGEDKYFDAAIKFPMDGEWKISVWFLGKSVTRDLTQRTGAGIPYNAGIVQHLYVTKEYGQFGFPEYYQVEGKIKTPTDYIPVSGYVDMDKPPILNEPVEIKWGAGSISGVEKVNFNLVFEYLEPGGRKRIPIPSEEIIVSGDKTQSISFMSKDEHFKNAFDTPVWDELDKTPRESIIEQSSVHFSTVARFPEEGDWKAILMVDWVDNDGKVRKAITSILCFNIAEGQSAWGWQEEHW